MARSNQQPSKVNAESIQPVPVDGANQHTVRLGQIFPLLVDAAANSRAWLTDFSDEPVQVSEDLYDVILAYQHFQEI